MCTKVTRAFSSSSAPDFAVCILSKTKSSSCNEDNCLIEVMQFPADLIINFDSRKLSWYCQPKIALICKVRACIQDIRVIVRFKYYTEQGHLK